MNTRKEILFLYTTGSGMGVGNSEPTGNIDENSKAETWSRIYSTAGIGEELA